MDFQDDKWEQISNTLTTLVVGQQNTNEHLRILNGKVAAQESNINTLLLWRARTEGFTGAISVGWTTLLTLCSGGFVLLVQWFFQK